MRCGSTNGHGRDVPPNTQFLCVQTSLLHGLLIGTASQIDSLIIYLNRSVTSR